MGFLDVLFSPFKKIKIRILIVGLDNSGKSTLVQKLKNPDKSPETIPTIGFHVDHFKSGKIDFTAVDMSGQGRYRDLWSYYFKDADAIVFVVDMADKNRISVAKEELHGLVKHPNLKEKRKLPILIVGNKMDIVNCINLDELIILLDVDSLFTNSDLQWGILKCQALNGDGVREIRGWLEKAL